MCYTHYCSSLSFYFSSSQSFFVFLSNLPSYTILPFEFFVLSHHHGFFLDRNNHSSNEIGPIIMSLLLLDSASGILFLGITLSGDLFGDSEAKVDARKKQVKSGSEESSRD